MIKIIKSNLFRLRKSKCFWLLCVVSLFLAIFQFFNNYTSNCVNCFNQLGEVFFGFNIWTWFLLPIFTSVFLGEDCSDGMLRNKVIMGNSKSKIYLANLLTTIWVSLILCTIYCITMGIIGLILKEGIGLSLVHFLKLLIESCLLQILYATVYTFIAILASSKASMASISLIIAIWLTFLVMNIQQALYEATGIAFTIYNIILNIIPIGHAYKIFNLISQESLWIYSLGLIIFINIIGVILFKKKKLF